MTATHIKQEGGTVATGALERPPLFYARVAGSIYLSAMALSIFSQMFVLDRMVVPGDAAATARNILASEGYRSRRLRTMDTLNSRLT